MSSLVQHGTDERATLCRWCWCSDPQPLLPPSPSFLPSFPLPPSLSPRSATQTIMPAKELYIGFAVMFGVWYSIPVSAETRATSSKHYPCHPSPLSPANRCQGQPLTGDTYSLSLSRARFPFQQSTTTRPRPIKWPLMPAFAVDRRAYFLQRGSKALHHCRSTDTVQPSLCLYDKSDKSGAVYGVFAVR